MSALPRLAAFLAGLAVLFAAGAGLGGLLDPDAPGGKAEAHDSTKPMNDISKTTHDDQTSHADTTAEADTTSPDVGGLALADDGLRLVLDSPELRRGTDERLRFRIVGDDGKPVREYDLEHTKRMHVIVVRRDLTGFQHLHPTLGSDGSWSTPLRLDGGGSYRVFADFSHDGDATTLAGDLRVDGPADLKPLPAPESAATSPGGYDVSLRADRARPGQETALRFAITREGRPVRVEPYLGAGGHLVALREGDLAFLHVHPIGHGHDEGSATDHENGIGFEATFPTAGRYRLFLQFQVDGRVQTVAFTQVVK